MLLSYDASAGAQARLVQAATELLGWQPSIPLRKGLEATIAYFAMRLATPGSPSEGSRRRSIKPGRPRLTLAGSQ